MLLPALVWGGQALSVLGVGITAFETTTVVRNVAVGDMTAGAAVRQELPGIAAGVALGAGGKVIGKAASHVMEAAHAKSLKDWQAVSGEQKTSIKEFFGKSHKGLDKLEKDFKLPDGLTKDTLQKYEGVATRQIQRGNDNNGLQARRLENIQKALE